MMLDMLRRIIHAALVMPFTAGLVTKRENGRFSVHDASISGLVLLTTLVIAVLEVMLIFPTKDSRWVMVGLLAFAICILITCSFLVHIKSDWKVFHRRKVTDRLKLAFLWLFCFGNIVSQAMKLALHIQCNVRESLSQKSIYYIITWLFDLGQTIFIVYFSRFRFANIRCFYYILMFLFVANISLWTRNNLDLYFEDIKDILNNSGHLCNNATTLYKAGRILKPFLDPVLLEYCLLSLIFISQMWPKQYVSLDNMHLFDSTSLSQDNGENYPLLSRNIAVLNRHTPMNRKSKCIVGLVILFFLSFIMIQCILMYITKFNQAGAPSAYYLFGNILRIPLTIKCYHALAGELQPKERPRKIINIQHFIILSTSLATCGYYILESLGIFRNDIRIHLNTVVRVTVTILQTTFILQMKQYRKFSSSNSVLSIRNIFLVMCFVNFSTWFSYTFMYVPYEGFINQPLFDSTTWLKFKHFWVPFVIFYHFECFIMFYHFYKE
ncbi:uncharacterized protein LOC127707817 [Mytilus californianus]|uniref:uncharacterized protein LOC127707817 n=1 Tax=Mytilus californianus TaxID=6549 RepID=UPI002247EA09|nr:uncharacterized protein LOC127707817 [Mytilus californianus]